MGFVDEALKSQDRFRRLVLLILVLLACSVVGGVIIIEYTRIRITDTGLEVEFTTGGALILRSKGDKLRASFLLPAAARWVNSGVTIKADQTVSITSSGLVHMGVGRVVEAADNDTSPVFPWIGPGGSPFKVRSDHNRDRDTAREELLIFHGNIGAVVGYLRLMTDDKPNLLHNPKPPGMFMVGDGTQRTNYFEQTAELWVIVNDILLDENAIQAYAGDEERTPDAEWKATLERWKVVRAQRAWDLYWDDNIGQFLVQVAEC